MSKAGGSSRSGRTQKHVSEAESVETEVESYLLNLWIPQRVNKTKTKRDAIVAEEVNYTNGASL